MVVDKESIAFIYTNILPGSLEPFFLYVIFMFDFLFLRSCSILEEQNTFLISILLKVILKCDKFRGVLIVLLYIITTYRSCGTFLSTKEGLQVFIKSYFHYACYQ